MLTRLPSESEFQMASGQGSLRHIENPTHYYLCIIFSRFELFADVVFKDATLPSGSASSLKVKDHHATGANK